MTYTEIKERLEREMMVTLPDYDWQVISRAIHQAVAEERVRVVEMIEKMNNFRQAKIDGKEEWNNALEQSACKVDSLLTSLQDTSE